MCEQTINEVSMLSSNTISILSGARTYLEIRKVHLDLITTAQRNPQLIGWQSVWERYRNY